MKNEKTSEQVASSEAPAQTAGARVRAKHMHHEVVRRWESRLPAGFVEHRRQARLEMLLAWRSLIDTAISRLEAKKPGA
jgi:hypothetical protein